MLRRRWHWMLIPFVPTAQSLTIPVGIARLKIGSLMLNGDETRNTLAACI